MCGCVVRGNDQQRKVSSVVGLEGLGLVEFTVLLPIYRCVFVCIHSCIRAVRGVEEDQEEDRRECQTLLNDIHEEEEVMIPEC